MIVKNVEEKDKKATIEVEVDAEAFEAAVNKAYLANRGSISIPGFRKGKAPRSVIEGMYGKEVFYQDALPFRHHRIQDQICGHPAAGRRECQ